MMKRSVSLLKYEFFCYIIERGILTFEIFPHLKNLLTIVNWNICLDTFLRRQLGSVAGPVSQANGRLTFEDDLRSGGLLYFISMNASVRTELADSMVTPGEPGGD